MVVAVWCISLPWDVLCNLGVIGHTFVITPTRGRRGLSRTTSTTSPRTSLRTTLWSLLARRCLGVVLACSLVLWSACGWRSHQLVLFVTADDFYRMAGSVLRDRQQAQELFDEWHALVGPRRQWGSEEVPSVAVDVDGVDVPDR